MLTPMFTREFLGWDRPFLSATADWLLGHREILPTALVIVPTSQSARRLREAMAETAGGFLAPTFTTPGALLHTADSRAAEPWMEQLAWIETLAAIRDWSEFEAILPPPAEGSHDWINGLANELAALRKSLQENGLTLADTARILAKSIEADRWKALATLEARLERTLRSWKLTSRNSILAKGIELPEASHIILAGVTEMPPLVERTLESWHGPVTALIAAPASLADQFSETGLPAADWTERHTPWLADSAGSIRLVANAHQAALEAVRTIGESARPSSDVALCAADPATGDDIARLLTAHGWTAFHPASDTVEQGLPRWFGVWSKWLADPQLTTVADLLALPQTGKLIGGRRAEKADRLARLRDRWMISTPDDFRRRMAEPDFRSDEEKQAAENLLAAIQSLESWRNDLLRTDFTGPLRRLTTILSETNGQSDPLAADILAWIESAIPLVSRVKRPAHFWIDLMRASLPAPVPQPPDDRVIDVLGWLEILFEPGDHLVLCGINDGIVPARSKADPWLGENAAKLLGLSTAHSRAARDAFLYHTLVESRRTTGRCDVICAKTAGDGSALLPSRFLLNCPRAELPARVKSLFRELEPPEARLRWQADWKWQPPAAEIPARLSATSFSAYLACPFRFYLKHAHHMQVPEPDRIEWNARDFGNVAHDVLERWGKDPEASQLNKTEAVHAWLDRELNRVVAEWFGDSPPLSVRLQTESLRKRLLWFARTQACLHADGWRVLEVEHKFSIPIGNSEVVAKIDRIDQHKDTGELRVIDYKTGKVESVEKNHRRRIIASTRIPGHLMDSPAIHSAPAGKKLADHFWTNLQLPLYALAIHRRDGVLATPAYFTLGSTENHVDITPWQHFGDADLEAAQSCAAWVVSQIEQRRFWPPAEKVTYDDFIPLHAGHPMHEMFAEAPPLEPTDPGQQASH